MAIIVEEKKAINWTSILIIAVLFFGIIGGAYFLFFTETPGIEIIVPAEHQKDKELSQIVFDEAFFNNNSFKILEKRPGASVPETTGRSNPFVKF